MTIASLADAPGILSAGSALLGLMNKAPRPNAARVFVNWIASKEGLQVLSLATLRPTTRNDIDESFLLAEDIPRPGLNYFDSVGWKFTVEDREKVRLRMKEILRSR